jgi:hypothetical protein
VWGGVGWKCDAAGWADQLRDFLLAHTAEIEGSDDLQLQLALARARGDKAGILEPEKRVPVEDSPGRPYRNLKPVSENELESESS